MFHYIKYVLFHILIIPQILGFILGGDWLYLGFAFAVGTIVIGDLLLGDDDSIPQYKNDWILSLQLYSSLIFIVAINFVLVWSISSSDPLGFGAMVHSLTGYDALAARETNTIPGLIIGTLGCGLLTSVVGTIVGHELTH